LSAPPIGCVPFQRTILGGLLRKCAEKYNDAAKLFNIKLAKELDSLNQNLPNARMVYLDVYNPLLDIILNYQNYGNLNFHSYYIFLNKSTMILLRANKLSRVLQIIPNVLSENCEVKKM